MTRISVWLAAIAAMIAVPAVASTYFTVRKTCPVGGQKFMFRELGSISTWGTLPDGMPVGSGEFPIRSPQCPGNGLVMFRDFSRPEIAKLTRYVQGGVYRGLRAAGETPYYLAFHTARMLSDADPEWLLLSATWEAKNAGSAATAQADRYNAEFVDLVRARAGSAVDFESIAMRARAANALRELGRFDEAEALRAAIVIAPDAGGSADDAPESREGWAKYLRDLAGPIGRRDMTRVPIDMMTRDYAVYRCLEKEQAAKHGLPEPAALTEFEIRYCARPELVQPIEQARKQSADAM